MEEQLELWPVEQQAAKSPFQWEMIDPKKQAALIDALARVMIKAVDPNQRSQNQEDNHE